MVKNLWFIVPVNSIENVFYKSNRPHYLWVYQRDNPLWMLEEHSKACKSLAFGLRFNLIYKLLILLFSQYPAWVIPPVNP